MLKLATDENFNGEILRGLLRRDFELDVRRMQDALPLGTSDPDILAWASAEGRLLLTHDRATMPDHAYQRASAGQPMPGIILVDEQIALGKAIDDILLLATCSADGEWEGQVVYVPF